MPQLRSLAYRTDWFADLDAAEQGSQTDAVERVKRHHYGRLRYGFASFGHHLEPLSIGHHRVADQGHKREPEPEPEPEPNL